MKISGNNHSIHTENNSDQQLNKKNNKTIEESKDQLINLSKNLSHGTIYIIDENINEQERSFYLLNFSKIAAGLRFSTVSLIISIVDKFVLLL